MRGQFSPLDPAAGALPEWAERWSIVSEERSFYKVSVTIETDVGIVAEEVSRERCDGDTVENRLATFSDAASVFMRALRAACGGEAFASESVLFGLVIAELTATARDYAANSQKQRMCLGLSNLLRKFEMVMLAGMSGESEYWLVEDAQRLADAAASYAARSE